MGAPENLRYMKSHEWARLEGDEVVIGITQFAVEALQDLVFLDLPEQGAKLTAGESFAEIESVKAVSDINAPVSGEVVAVNDSLADELEALKEDPYGAGWMVRVKVEGDAKAAFEALLDAPAYDAVVAEEEH